MSKINKSEDYNNLVYMHPFYLRYAIGETPSHQLTYQLYLPNREELKHLILIPSNSRELKMRGGIDERFTVN